MGTCRVHAEFTHDDPALLARFAGLATSLVSDSMDRVGGVRGVRPITGSVRSGTRRMVGHALTVQTAHGDNLAVHQALEMLVPGRVLLVDAGGADDRAIVGEIMCSYARSRGAAGVVIDGAVRDSAELAAGDLPVFASAVAHQGPYKNGPGAIGGPICVGGTGARAGDIVVGDADGVVIVPRERAHEVAALAEHRGRSEEQTLREIREGTYRPAWLAEAIRLVPADAETSKV
jgi:regulator of RNase E activity RraA